MVVYVSFYLVCVYNISVLCGKNTFIIKNIGIYVRNAKTEGQTDKEFWSTALSPSNESTEAQGHNLRFLEALRSLLLQSYNLILDIHQIIKMPKIRCQ